MDRRFLCVHCTPYEFVPDLPALKNHFNTKHGKLSVYICGKCNQNFIHKTSFIRHTEKHHAKENSEDSSEDSEDDEMGGEAEEEDELQMGEGFERDEDRAEDTIEEGNEENITKTLDLKEEAALFLLNLRASGNLTNTSISMVIACVSVMVKNVLLKAKHDTERFLAMCDVPPANSKEFLNSTFSQGNLFEGLDSTDKELDYYSEKFGLVIPEEKLLSTRVENRFDRSLRMFIPKQVPETFHYVSLIETLTLAVRNSFVRNLILSETPSEDGIYRSYKDGSDFKNNEFLQKYPNAIRLVLYYDGLEIANALGSKDVVHALGCFYISIQNLPAEESSLLSSIFLLALCYAQDLKKHGAFGKVLTMFLAELKQLQSDDGVEIDLPGGEKFILRACLVSLTADTLAAHELLGLLSPSANKFCRACLVSKHDFTEDTTAIGTMRNSRLHEENVREVEQRPASSSLHGVKERSPLSDAMRVPEDCVFDAFHDLVGVIQMILKLALYEYVLVRKLFSVEDFNTNINMFNYGKPDSKNKPSANLIRKRLYSSGHSLRQYGSQTFCLLRVFPFLISGVSETDSYLELVFLLQDIVQIIFSYEVRDSDINRLQTLIYQFGTHFHEVFISPGPLEPRDFQEENEENDDNDERDDEEEVDEPDEEEEEEQDDDPDDPGAEVPTPRRRRVWTSRKLKKGINKLHHLVHYPQQMREKGPIIRLWCARYEGRHRILRKHSAVQSNFKNPPMTMARMYQMSTLAAFLARDSPREHDFSLAGSVCHVIRHSPYSELLMTEGLQETDKIQVVESAKVSGEEYQPGLFVMLKQDGVQARPSFAVIVEVLATTDSSKVFLVVNKCRNSTFSARYNCYQISNQFDEGFILTEVKNLASHRSIVPWNPLDGSDCSTLYLYPRTVSV